MSIRAGKLSFHFLMAVAGGLAATGALAVGLTIWWLHSDAVHNASKEAGNIATLLAEQINTSIQSIDLALTEIQGQVESRGAQAPNDFNRLLRGEDTHQLLMERLSHLPQAERISLFDKDGRLVSTTFQSPPAGINISDREYFQHFRNTDDRGVYINFSLADRMAGGGFVVFSKRINGADNAFLGVVVVGVRPAYFQHIYKSIAALNDQSFLLLYRDGTVIVRYPDLATRTGEKLPAGSPWYGLVSQGGGYYRSPGYFDGEARLVGVRPLRDHPLVVNVAVSETAALANWRIQAIILGIGALLVKLCLGLVLKALHKQFHLRATSEAALIDKTNELVRANAKIEIALNNMLQGLVMFDSSARLIVCNQRYLEMYGLSPEIARPGCTLRELLDHQTATSSFCTDDIDQYMADIQAAASQGVAIRKNLELNDGRIIHVVNEPIVDGGWVATHEDITEQKLAEERIEYAAHHDALTGLPNRTLFSKQLNQALKRVRRGEHLAILYFDLDNFKRVNDTVGHPAGDKLLKSVADRLRGCIREIDFVARLSGDEFAIIQVALDQPSDAAALAIRIRNIIIEPIEVDGHQIKLETSVGISVAPNDSREPDDLLKAADIALYEVKNTGRGTFCFYEPEMNMRMQARSKLERDMESAIANGEFELFYQPIVDLEDNKINSFEALLRWRHPERGIVSPAEFIPAAEETGLIVPLGEWVLRAACAEAATWPDDIAVAVNVSAIQLRSENLVSVIAGAIASAGIRTNRLEIELTESVFIQNTSASIATLKILHDLGVRFAMDDFGTGYSSLGYLLKYPFSKIKIDQSFIIGLPDKKESLAIIRAISDLARGLNMRVIAEGVETAQQLEQLRILGCTEMQGYLFSPPRPAAEIHQLFLHDESRVNIVNQEHLRETAPCADAEVVGIEGGVVSGVFNLESSDVRASDWRPRHDERYHKA